MKRTLLLSGVLLAVLVLLGVASWRLDRDTRDYGQALVVLDTLDLADSILIRDVLRARAGLLRNYDSLVAADQRGQQALQELARLARGDARLEAIIAQVARDYSAKQQQLERFKSLNALLTNSLAWFWKQGALPPAAGQGADGARLTSALTSAVQRLSLDTGPEAVAHAQRSLAAIDKGQADASLVRHGQLLVRMLPETDAAIGKMQPLAEMPAFGLARTAVAQRVVDLRDTATHVRTSLMVIAIAMLCALFYLAMQLRRRAWVQQRRAAFDAMLVAVSRDLATRDARDLEPSIEGVLHQIAAWCGLPLVGLSLVADDAPTRVWPDSDAAALREVVANAEGLSGSHPATGGHLFLVTPEAGAPMALWQDLAEQPVDARWLGIRRPTEAGTTAILWLHRKGPGHVLDCREELSLLVTLLDTLAGALQRRRLERAGKVFEQRLERALRLEAVGTMASGIAHNFNNIIGAIRGNAEAAAMDLAVNAPAAGHVAEISQATARASELVDAILGFSRAQNHVMQVVDLNALLDECLSMLAALLPPTVTVRVQGPQERLHAMANPAQLQQVFLNLGVNAAQAMSMVGEILISVRAMEGSDAQGRQQRMAELSISDQGVGIPPASAERIFDAFYTTRDAGTGLGLATVKQIVANHQGRIEMHSEVGIGTTFRVRIPLCSARELADAQQRLPASPHRTVLLLCSDAAMLARLEELVAALGHEPVGHVDPDAALLAVTLDPQGFDCVLVHAHSAAFARHILTAHRADPRLPMLLAARSEWLAGLAGLADGIAGIIALPIDPAALAQAIARVIGNGTPHAAAVTTATNPRAYEIDP